MAPDSAVDIELPAYSAGPEPPKPIHSPSAPPYTAASNPACQTGVADNIPPPRSPSRLFSLTLPIALFIGAAITASTTYALVRRVQHLVADASVDSSAETWISAARTEVYDPCYLGCATDCPNPKDVWNACQRTVSLASGCDANNMWNWADRYPAACLAAMGDVLRADALARLKQNYRNQLALVILTVVAGIVGGSITYCLVRRWAGRRERKASLKRSMPPPYRRKPTRGTMSRAKVRFAAASLGLFAARRARAYACTGRDPPANQSFVGANGTVRGVVRGWWSDCYDVTSCSAVCSRSCDGQGSCSQSCSTSCYTTTYTDKAPARFVLDAARRVEGCGFSLVDGSAAGSTPDVRVANAKIEKELWVSIRVNGYNVTRPDQTDESVLCLHAIGG